MGLEPMFIACKIIYLAKFYTTSGSKFISNGCGFQREFYMRFPGSIMYAVSKHEAEESAHRLWRHLEQQKKTEECFITVGFDTEWKPNFKRGKIMGIFFLFVILFWYFDLQGSHSTKQRLSKFVLMKICVTYFTYIILGFPQL